MSILVSVFLFALIPHITSLSCPCKDQSLCDPVKPVPEKENVTQGDIHCSQSHMVIHIFSMPGYTVFVFLENLGPATWQMFDWSRITTIAYTKRDFTYVSELMCLCHQHSVRLVALESLDMPTQNLTDPVSRRNWINNKLAKVLDNHLDGINVDVEAHIYLNETDKRDGFTQLVLELKLALSKHNAYTQVSVDVLCAPNLYPRYYDYTALGIVSDFLFVMDYDEGGGNPASANSNFFSTQQGLQKYVAIGVPTNKLVMGVPWYGYGWQCSKIVGDACYSTQQKATDPRRNYKSVAKLETTGNLRFSPVNYAPSYCYKDIVNILKTGGIEWKWNTHSLTPFFFFKISDSIMAQMQYDNPDSLTLKSGLAINMNLKGVGVWILECLDWSNTPEAANERAALWATLPKYK